MKHKTGDWVHLYDLKLATNIGVHDWEQRIKQTLLVSLDMQVDLSSPVTALEQSVDYAAVGEAVEALVTGSSFALIETVAQAIAERVLTQFNVKGVRVLVKKPHALRGAAGVGVCIERMQSDKR